MAASGSTQFKISMLLTGVDELSPELKKVTSEVKKFKDQSGKIGDEFSPEMKKMTDDVRTFKDQSGRIGDKFSPVITKMTGQVTRFKNVLVGGGSGGGPTFFDSLNKGLQQTTKHLDDLSKRFSEMKTNGFMNILTGSAMVAPVVSSLSSAGQFQQGMVTVSGATGATSTDIADLKNVIRDASNVTKFTTAEVQQMAIKEATSGMSISQVDQLTPIMSKFAEVQQFGKGTSADESVVDAISSAHMLGIYDPKQLDAYLNNFNKATFMSPGSTSEFFDTFKYAAPTAKGLGLSNEDILYTSALANRVGFLGSMGGTESADMILRSIPGIFGGQGHVNKDGTLKPSQQLKAMIDLGLAKSDGSSVFYNNQGQFLGIENFINNLSEAAKKVNPEQLTKDFKNMFGLQGMKLADILSARGGEQLEIIKQQMDSMKSITQLQEDYNKSYEGQLAQFKTNLGNLNQDIGTTLLPEATHLLNVMQPFASSASKWIQTHQEEVEKIAKVTAELGGLLLVLGGAKIAIGTIGALVIDPLKVAVKSFGAFINSFKTKNAATKTLPEQAMQANVVNVYGKVVNGSGAPGGGSVLEPEGGGKGKSVILDSKGRPIPSTVASEGTVLTEEAVQTVTKSGLLKKGLQTGGKLLKGAASRGGAMLPVSLALGAYDVATAPEGHKVETAMKATGTTLGGWAGAEAGAALGATLGSVVPGIGTAVGGVLGAVIGGVAGGALANHLTDSLMNWIKGNQDKADPKAVAAFQSTAASWSPVKFQNDIFAKQMKQAHQKLAQSQSTTYTDNSTYAPTINAPSSADVLDTLHQDYSNFRGNLDKRKFQMTNSQ